MIESPVMSDKQIEECAYNFLTRYNVKGSFAVDAEEIIDLKLNINVVDFSDLLKKYKTIAFITGDFKDIYIDESIHDDSPTIHKPYLMHEIGHMLLHKECFKECKFDTIEEWRECLRDIDEYEYHKLEYQSDTFAEYALVPTYHLKNIFEIKLDKIIGPLINSNLNGKVEKKAYLNPVIDYMAGVLTPNFDVTQDFIKKRIIKEGLDKMIP